MEILEPRAEVKVFFFRKMNKSVLKEIFSEAKKVGRFIADKDVHLKLCDSMIPLPQRTMGGFMSPLRDS